MKKSNTLPLNLDNIKLPDAEKELEDHIERVNKYYESSKYLSWKKDILDILQHIYKIGFLDGGSHALDWAIKNGRKK